MTIIIDSLVVFNILAYRLLSLQPRTIPDNRTYPSMGPDNSKQRQFSESSPRSNGVVPGKAGDKR